MSHVETMTMSNKSWWRVVTTFLNFLQLKKPSFHSFTFAVSRENVKSYFSLIFGVAQVSRGCGAGGVFSTQGKRKRQDLVNFTSCWYWWVYPGNTQLLCLIAEHLGVSRLPSKGLSLWHSLPMSHVMYVHCPRVFHPGSCPFTGKGQAELFWSRSVKEVER